MKNALLITSLSFSLLAGCGVPPPGTCVPGATAACACSAGSSGSQTCANDGTFSACTCTSGTPVVTNHKVVFVTSSVFDGDLGGLSGADAKCNLAAQAGQLPGTFKAWLSTSAMNGLDRQADVGPWFLVGTDTKAFNNRANLATSPLTRINITEQGTVLSTSAESRVWTGTSPGGSRANMTCSGWTTAYSINGLDYRGLIGSAWETDGAWTEGNTLGAVCDEQLRLFCLQQ